MSQLFKVREIVNKYDPEDFVAMDAPSDEYDDYVNRILSLCSENKLSPEALSQVFRGSDKQIDYVEFTNDLLAVIDVATN